MESISGTSTVPAVHARDWELQKGLQSIDPGRGERHARESVTGEDAFVPSQVASGCEPIGIRSKAFIIPGPAVSGKPETLAWTEQTGIDPADKPGTIVETGQSGAGSVRKPVTTLTNLIATGAANNPTTLAFEVEPILPDNVSEAEFMGAFTNPRRHNQESFCYAVHAVKPDIYSFFREWLKKEGTYNPGQDIDLLKQPERISERKRIFCSVISPEHLATWSRCMFVLKFPFNSVMSTTTNDSGLFAMNTGQGDAPGALMTPRNMLKQSGDINNELVLSGNGVSVQAIAVKIVEANGKRSYPEDTEKFRALAGRLKVPFLEIVEKSPIADSPPRFIVHEDGRKELNTCRDGWRYKFMIYPEGNPDVSKQVHDLAPRARIRAAGCGRG